MGEVGDEVQLTDGAQLNITENFELTRERHRYRDGREKIKFEGTMESEFEPVDGVQVDVEGQVKDERYMDGRYVENRYTEERPTKEPFMEPGDSEWQQMKGQVYNIIPVEDTQSEHPALQFPEVRAAIAALKDCGGLRVPDLEGWGEGMDMLDWLGSTFGFQEDNVKNQREHIVLLLANVQMRLQSPDVIDTLKVDVVRTLRKKVTKNYLSWCYFLNIPSSIQNLEGHTKVTKQKELLFAALYFLIWGEAANLRFMPECLCFLFHHMAKELNGILNQQMDRDGQPVRAATEGQLGFLSKAIEPIYSVVRDEAESQTSREGAAHSAWRNYDDMNEYFWSNSRIGELSWPMSMSCNYLVPPQTGKGKISGRKVGKIGFVERRSFWNVYRSFDRLWVGLILVLQLMIMVAFRARSSGRGDMMPWTVLSNRDAQARVLSVFITWAGLRTLQAVLDILMQYSLTTVGTLRARVRVGIRMALKMVVACVWVVLFSVYYNRMWSQRQADGSWTSAALQYLYTYLGFTLAFIAPEILAVLLFIIPFVRNAVERSNSSIFRKLMWWFHGSSFVGRGLHESVFDNLKYTLFWLVVILLKVSFSYFLQILPLVRPTRATLNNQTGTIKYRWHEFFKGANRAAVLCTWTPVILIYFMDLQIWYALVSSLVGGFIGLLRHLGEIRNIEQMRLRFRFFPSAVIFNLMPEEGLNDLKERKLYSWMGRVQEAVRRFRLRLGMPVKKSDAARNIEIRTFKDLWNDIIMTFREEDIVGDHEVELLKMPDVGWNISVTQWPLILLSNEVQIALRYCDLKNRDRRWYQSDRWLWSKISNNEYRRCAVIETWESLIHILSRIIRQDNDDRHIFPVIFKEIGSAIQQRRFIKTFKLQCLPKVHECLIKFIDALMNRPQRTDTQVIFALQDLFEVLVRDFPRDRDTKAKFHELASQKLLSTDAVELPNKEDHKFFHELGSEKFIFNNAVDLPNGNDHKFFAQLTRLHTALSNKLAFLDVPKSLEARRRLAFFGNSIFMTMPRAPQVERMLAFSVLTPYNAEDAIYDKSQLTKKNEDGVSTLFYLQEVFPEDWGYFKERMAKQGIDENGLWDHDGGLQIRLWASYRGQTLVRTVRGMMYNARALQKLAFLDVASEPDSEGQEFDSRNVSTGNARTGIKGTPRHSSLNFDVAGSGSGSGSGSRSTKLDTGHQIRATALMKFTYVVSYPDYHEHKTENVQLAADMLYLLKTYQALRVAYLHQTDGGSGPKKCFSVLVKYDPFLGRDVEIFRIQLPGPWKLGEGKPESQNHALIFTRGDALQTIDMNQENYYEESLKMRNLLEEFDNNQGIRKPAILGVREHIFSGAVSSLASFMSAQEMSFVTLGQRVLANPLKVRMHYGHPDVFDRLWSLTRGGISKASKLINISEDIYAGFNATLRGGTVTHHEYIQVGKGRDVGLHQTAKFEAKLASGNGEQMLSRDIYRLGHRLDFVRMMSVYYTTVGFYVSNLIVVLAVYAFLWARCFLALSGIEDSISGNSRSNSAVFPAIWGNSEANTALSAALNQQFLVQLGVLTALPGLLENSLEKGFLRAAWEFLIMQLQLASVFFAFSMGTRAHFFGRTILHGGASYRETGRGFVTRRETFTANYKLYSRSHFVKGIEIILLLIVYQAYGSSKNTFVNVLTTYSSWFLGVTWILAPFLFNPSGFDWLNSVEDFDGFISWVWDQDKMSVKGTDSWFKWWDEQQNHFRTTGLRGKAIEIVIDLRFFLLQYGIVYRLQISSGSTSILVYIFSWVYICIACSVYLGLTFAADRYGAKQQLRYRSIEAVIILLILLATVMLFKFTNISILDIFASMLAFIPTGWGVLLIAITLRSPWLEKTRAWPLVVEAARAYDLAMGLFVMAPVAFLSWLPGFQTMQTRILFNEAFRRGLQIHKILNSKLHN